MNPRQTPHSLECAQSDSYFAHAFLRLPAMVILRGMDVGPTVELACRFWEMGVSLIEVPVGSARARAALAATVKAAESAGAGEVRAVGAGTVRSEREVGEVAEAGAQFTVSPGWDSGVAQASLDAGLPHLGGVMSPTEVHQATRFGLSWLKLFPASVLGPDHIRALRGPFPGVHLVATGGVDTGNASLFLESGAGAVSFGSSAARAPRVDFETFLHDIDPARQPVPEEDPT
jgi:2-dehydro-3-deoxyphosphogluconate aldolase/(4S)-4-hydroxy-2-oxoglutarate aldolase